MTKLGLYIAHLLEKKASMGEMPLKTDRNQKEYREFFGIEDLYLIQEEHEERDGEKWGYIVFIDQEKDVDWIDLRDDLGSEDERNKRDASVARINMTQFLPCYNISENDILSFKKMIGSAYVLALQKQNEEVPIVLEQATSFIKQRNREFSRKIYLGTGLVGVMVTSIVILLNFLFCKWQFEWMVCIGMGVVGAFVSVWSRYGKNLMTGLSSKGLHVLESVSRLLIGAIFAFIAACAVKCGFLLSSTDHKQVYEYIIIGFIAGFSERLVPFLVETIISKENVK